MKRFVVLLAALGLLAAGCQTKPSDSKGGVVAELPAVNGASLATHGNDPLPPPKDGEGPRTVREVQWPCIGNGEDGPRVQMLYVHAAGAGTLTSLRPTFESYARRVEGAFAVSAEETGGSRLLRLQTNANCELYIGDVTVSANALASFGTMNSELAAQGFNHKDRKYHAWVEADAYCGIGTVYGDDRPGQDNPNATGPSYARSDRKCWNYSEAHEIAHNLGAVQDSAPHASGGLHCNDEYDVMCYADGGSKSKITITCAGQARDDQYDCNHDDYFSTSPAAGSYLATHWNIANSSWLVNGPPGSTTTTTAPPTPISTTPTTIPPPPPTTVPPTGSVATQTLEGFWYFDATGKGTKADNVIVGKPVTVVATVYSSTPATCVPSGVVAFYVSGRLIERVALGPTDKGAASAYLAVQFSSPGRFTVRTEYAGSPSCGKSKDSVRKTVKSG